MKHSKIIITAILSSIILTSCANTGTNQGEEVTTTQNENDTQAIQYYKDSITQLENQLLTLREEAYIMSTTYELKIRELEEYIATINSSATEDETTPNQNVSLENAKINFEYTLTSEGAVITKYTGNASSISVPSSIEGRSVVKISEYAFSETNVKTVILPNGICEIDWFAFYKCPFLEKIYIPSSVSSIGYGAFDYCASALTIFCENNSYAQKYAQSFGIKYSNQ